MPANNTGFSVDSKDLSSIFVAITDKYLLPFEALDTSLFLFSLWSWGRNNYGQLGLVLIGIT